MLAYAVFSILSDQQQQQKYKHIVTTTDVLFFATFFRSLTFFPHNNIVGKNSVFGTQLHTYKLGLFGTLKLVLALQFIVTNAYFSVACNTKVSVRATLK